MTILADGAEDEHSRMFSENFGDPHAPGGIVEKISAAFDAN